MTRLVESIKIDIELEDDPLHDIPDIPWRAIQHLSYSRGKWHLSAPCMSIWVTALGVEEVPEEGGGDN